MNSAQLTVGQKCIYTRPGQTRGHHCVVVSLTSYENAYKVSYVPKHLAAAGVDGCAILTNDKGFCIGINTVGGVAYFSNGRLAAKLALVA